MSDEIRALLDAAAQRHPGTCLCHNCAHQLRAALATVTAERDQHARNCIDIAADCANRIEAERDAHEQTRKALEAEKTSHALAIENQCTANRQWQSKWDGLCLAHEQTRKALEGRQTILDDVNANRAELVQAIESTRAELVSSRAKYDLYRAHAETTVQSLRAELAELQEDRDTIDNARVAAWTAHAAVSAELAAALARVKELENVRDELALDLDDMKNEAMRNG